MVRLLDSSYHHLGMAVKMEEGLQGYGQAADVCFAALGMENGEKEDEKEVETHKREERVNLIRTESIVW